MAGSLTKFYFAPAADRTKTFKAITNVNYTYDPRPKQYINDFLGMSFTILMGKYGLVVSL